MKPSRINLSKFDKHGFLLLYLASLFITIIIFVVSLCASPHPVQNEEIVDYSDKWFYDIELSLPADLSHPLKNCDYEEGKSISYYAQLPSRVESGACLWLRAKNCMLDIYIIKPDGSKILQYRLKGGTDIYGKSQGTVWVSIPIEQKDKDRILQIDFIPAYDDSSCYIDNILFGNEGLIIKEKVAERLIGVATSIIMAIIGFILIIIHFSLKKSNIEYTNDLIFLGIFAIVIACWTFSEIKFLQLFVKNTGAIHNLSSMSLMLIVIPLFLYFGKDNTKMERAVSFSIMLLSAFNFVICCALHFLCLYDFHSTIFITHITIGVAVCGILFFSIKEFITSKTTGKNFLSSFGMLMLGILSTIDIIRYRIGGVNDTALFTRIGVLVFVIALGVNSLLYAIEMVKKGLSSDLISRLAYTDGLTELGNRTAYMEKLEEIEQNESNTIFMFDINNLKKINDNMGHHAGDTLIISGANLIKEFFGDKGACYRIGGDEFVCIVEYEINPESIIPGFLDFVEDYNDRSDLSFPVSIAVGAAVYTKNQNLSEIIEEADKKMYKCKAVCKGLS